MKKCILLSYLAIFAAYVPNVAAQFASPCNTVDLEIMLAVEEVEGVWVSVTNLENNNIVYSDVVFSDDNVHQNCDWVANVGGVSSGITGAVDLEDNTLYKIEIGTYVFAYFGCEPGFDLFGEGFYCPNGGSASQADLYFVYGQGGDLDVAVFVEAIASDYGDVTNYFSDSSWIVPYNLDIVCASNPSKEQSCLNAANQISFFVSPQLGPSFTLASADIVLPAGKTWYWGDVTVKFATGKRLMVYGTFNANGTTFKEANSNGWGGIRFNWGSVGDLDNVTIDGVKVGYGGSVISINSGNPYVDIHNSTIYNDDSNLADAIAVGSSSGSHIYDNYIKSSRGHAIRTEGYAAPQIRNNDLEVTGSGHSGVYARSNAKPGFLLTGLGLYDGQNEFTGDGYALWATGSGTQINAGMASDSANDNYFCSTGNKLVRAEQGALVGARYNYWPGGTSSDLVEVINGGTANTTPENAGPAECSSTQPVVFSSPSRAPAALSVLTGDELDYLLEAEVRAARGSYLEAVLLLKTMLEAQPVSPYARFALVGLGHIFTYTKDLDIVRYVERRFKPGHTLHATALGVLLHVAVVVGDLSRANALAQEITKTYVSTEHAFNAKIELFYLHYNTGAYDGARAILEGLEAQTEDERLQVATARWLFGDTLSAAKLKQDRVAVAEPSMHDYAAEMADAIEILSYPNPFNYTTVFRYELPEGMAVRLSVYDVLGREVARLVDGRQAAGQHEILFDGSRLTSGIYLYGLEAADTTVNGAILLVK